MILGIGCDVIYILRFKRLYTKERFVNRILTKNELELYSKLNDMKKPNFLAKRWAAKEAFSKAIGTGIGRKFHNVLVDFQSIEVINNNNGTPQINILGDFAKHIGACFISFTDEHDVIFCSVVVEKP